MNNSWLKQPPKVAVGDLIYEITDGNRPYAISVILFKEDDEAMPFVFRISQCDQADGTRYAELTGTDKVIHAGSSSR